MLIILMDLLVLLKLHFSLWEQALKITLLETHNCQVVNWRIEENLFPLHASFLHRLHGNYSPFPPMLAPLASLL